jgi:hypothetical protein
MYQNYLQGNVSFLILVSFPSKFFAGIGMYLTCLRFWEILLCVSGSNQMISDMYEQENLEGGVEGG